MMSSVEVWAPERMELPLSEMQKKKKKKTVRGANL